ncbi:MAG: hypothetical protein ACOCOY_03355, partial [Prevotella sp.]
CGRVAIAPSKKAKAFTLWTRKLTNVEEKENVWKRTIRDGKSCHHEGSMTAVGQEFMHGSIA